MKIKIKGKDGSLTNQENIMRPLTAKEYCEIALRYVAEISMKKIEMTIEGTEQFDNGFDVVIGIKYVNEYGTCWGDKSLKRISMDEKGNVKSMIIN
jgi:hypothetical protein